MTLSAAFSIEGTTVPQSTGDAVEIAYSDVVNLALLSTTGVTSVQWTIFGTSSNLSATPTITTTGVPSGATAYFQAAADQNDGGGISYGVCCTVTDSVSSVSAYGAVGVPAAYGAVPPIASESLARHDTQGWTKLISDMAMGFPVYAAKITTTDATPATATTVAIPTDKVRQIRAIWSAKDASSTDRLYRHAVGTWRDDSGVVTALGSEHDVIATEDDATWDASFNTAQPVEVNYTGDATNNVDWRIFVWTFTPGN